MPYKFFILFCTSLFLFSCSQEPAQVVMHPTTSPAKIKAVSKNPYKVTVEKGDTLYSIARRHNVEIRDMIEQNNLRPPYVLIPGQTVRLPNAAFHIVSKTDTLYAISRSYGVDIGRLAKKNNITPPYSVMAGQKLFLPAKASEEPAAVNEEYDFTTREQSDSTSVVQTHILEPITPSAQVAVSAPEPEVSSTDIAPLSAVPSASTGNHVIPVPVIRNTTNAQAKRVPTISKVAVASDAVPEQVEKKKQTERRREALSFKWPTSGKVISNFGPKKGGLYNDGINIAAKEGAPITAAESGDVVYAGNELRGYGNMLLIKHNNGYLTAYAHAGDLVAKKGDTVKKGDLIAHVGQTGHVSSPQLHFSIREGRKARNPISYLP